MKQNKKYQEILDEYPSEISKEQLYKICKVSKRTTSYIEADKASGDANTARKMASLGLKTELEVQGIEQSLDKLNHSIEAIENSISKLKTQINLYIDVDESAILIESFEGISAEKADELLAADMSGNVLFESVNSETRSILLSSAMLVKI